MADLPDIVVYEGEWGTALKGYFEGVVLTIDDESTEDAETFTTDDTLYLSYSIRNVGSSEAGANSTGIFIDNSCVSYSESPNGIGVNKLKGIFHLDIGSLSEGYHTLTIRCDAKSEVEESNEENNVYTREIYVERGKQPIKTYLLDVSWSQKGDGVLVYEFNKYVPFDCLTGCSNVSQGQVIYYWAQMGYDMSVTVKNTDYFTYGTTKITGDDIAATCGISLDQLNEILSEITYDSPNWDEDDDICGLLFAGMLVNHSKVTNAESTSTRVDALELFDRAGLSYDYDDENPMDYARIVKNLEGGCPVLVCLSEMSHTVVVDGYDQTTDSVHINFGWGLLSKKEYNEEYGAYEGTGWYSRKEFEDWQVDAVVYDIRPNTDFKPIIYIQADTETPSPYVVIKGTVKYANTIYYSINSTESWNYFSKPLTIKENCTVYFMAYNVDGQTIETVKIGNIDGSIEPLTVTQNIEKNTFHPVTLTPEFWDDSATVKMEYRLGEYGAWQEVTKDITVTANGNVTFKWKDDVGNSGTTTTAVTNIVACEVSAPDSDGIVTITLGKVEDAVTEEYSLDKGATWKPLVGRTAQVTRNGDVQVRMLDGEGAPLLEDSITVTSFSIPLEEVKETKKGDAAYLLSWQADYSQASWANAFKVEVSIGQDRLCLDGVGRNGVQLYNVVTDASASVWRVRLEQTDDWYSGLKGFALSQAEEPQKLVADADGAEDVFMARVSGIWGETFGASYQGTGEADYVWIGGKNRFSDVIQGADDASALYLTDSANGDAFFMEDIYSACPEACDSFDSRVGKISAIYAGGGGDLVDLTGCASYEAAGIVSVYGGEGDDVLWGGDGSNWLFGGQGKDTLVGSASDDVLAGGSENDTLSGGGGNDVFCFCDNWGEDIVHQSAGGTVTLWFKSGSMEYWSEETMTYDDGVNKVSVEGVSTASPIFGDDGSELYKELVAAGAFEANAYGKVFLA